MPWPLSLSLLIQYQFQYIPFEMETVVLCPNLFQLYLNVINGMSQATGDVIECRSQNKCLCLIIGIRVIECRGCYVILAL